MDSIIVPASKRPFHSIPIPLCDQMLFDEGEMSVRTWWQDTRSRFIWTLLNVPILWIWTGTRMRGRLLTFKYAILQTDINVDEDEEEREAPGVGRQELITD